MAEGKDFKLNEIAANLLSSNPRNVERAINDLSELFSVVDTDSKSLRTGLDKSSVDSINEHFDKLSQFLDLNSRVLKDVLDLHEAKVKIQQEKVRVLKEEIDLLISNGEVESERYQQLVSAYKENTKILKGLKKYQLALEKGERVSEGLLQATLGLQTGWSELGIASARGFFPGVIKGLAESLTLSNLFGSTVTKVFERVMAYDAAQASIFEKAAISRDRIRLVEAASELGAVSKDVEGILGNSAVALKTNLRTFGDLSDFQAKETTKTIGVLSRFGVSMEESAQTFTTLTATLGKTPGQANEVMNNFVGVAEAIGRPPGELLSDFNKAAPILTRFGSQSEKIFKDITLQAKNLEMEVAQVLNLSEGVDTFEGAAKAAQAFNIAIGQPFLSAQQLLAADPAEKLQMFADAYKRAGSPDLSPRVLRGLGEDLAMPVDELQRVLKLQKDKFDGQRDQMDTAETTLESNVLKAQNSLTVQGKIDAALTNLIDKLVHTIDGDKMLNWVATTVSNHIGKVVIGLGALGAAAAVVSAKVLSRGATPMNPEHVKMAGMGGAVGAGKRRGKFGKGLAIAGAATAIGGAMFGAAYLLEKGAVFDKEDNQDRPRPGAKPKEESITSTEVPEPPKPLELLHSGFFDEKMQQEVAKEEQKQKKQEAQRAKDLELIKAENIKTQGVIMSLASEVKSPEIISKEAQQLLDEKTPILQSISGTDKELQSIMMEKNRQEEEEIKSGQLQEKKKKEERRKELRLQALQKRKAEEKKRKEEKARELQEKKAKEAQAAKSPVKEALNEEKVADNLSEKQFKGIRRELIVPATEDGTVSLMGFNKSPEREQFDKDYPPGNVQNRRDLMLRNRRKDKYQRQYLLRTGQLKKIVTYEDLTSPMSTMPNMSTGNLEQNYVQPVFNKKDKFYAAKADGPLAKALDEILAVTKKLLEQKGDVELSISERKFAAAVEDSLATVQRRT